jgi:phage terminase large subunit-like protein
MHAAVFTELETQMTTYDPDGSASPDRVDALVWAITELMPSAIGSSDQFSLVA